MSYALFYVYCFLSWNLQLVHAMQSGLNISMFSVTFFSYMQTYKKRKIFVYIEFLKLNAQYLLFMKNMESA